MKKRLFTRTRACWLIAAGAAGALGIANAQDPDAKAKLTTLAAGSDYLQTGPGTEATLPIAGKPLVTLSGVPIPGFANSDTIIERTQDAVFTADDAEPDTGLTASVPITLTALNLTGTVAGPNGGQCTVNLTLAPSPASTGTLILTKASAAATSGKYHSDVNVYFNATFTPISPNTTCYPPILKAPPCKFRQAGGSWSTTPQPGEFLYTGTYPGVQYNQHTGLPGGFGDFYITAPQTDTAATAAHATCEALQAMGTTCSTTGAAKP
jgi:hypothetical protein